MTARAIAVGFAAALALAAAGPAGYWAFRPVVEPPIPETPSPWVRTEVDRFILAGLAAKGLEPSPAADPHRLLRRVYLDLAGLPPTPEQVEEYMADRGPRAYELLVDRLMDSPAYGERWALKWLDVVRYADTDGFELDGEREQYWRYRDYVVRAFQTDKPFDLFLQEQVAGDELFPGNPEALVATGFLRAGPRHVVGGNQDKEEARQEELTEMTYGVGAVFLGLTVQCARCHDHKFDPIPQDDYYRLQAFFEPVDFVETPISSDADALAYKAAKAAHEARLAPLKERLAEMEAPYHEEAKRRKVAELAPELRAALEKPKEKRTPEEEDLSKDAMRQAKVAWFDMLALMPNDVKTRRAELRRQLHALEQEAPDRPPTAFAVRNAEGEPPPTHVLKVGNHKMKLHTVQPAFLQAVGALGLEPPPASAAGRRAALARWLTHPEHPLTARVMANRVWEFRMGRGLVDDANNFGLLGGANPSHPELLDFLAARLVASGWSVKALDRMIVLSAAYRQSAANDPARAEADPGNRLYWRANRRRLEAETLRDSILAAAGRLNAAVGGKPVLVPIEPEVYDLIFTEAEPDNLWPVTPDPAEHRRRSLYLLNRRTVRLPFLANFDQPDTMTSCATRPTSTHALQALSMLNSDFIVEQSRAFAERVEAACGADAACSIERAYAFALARPPSEEERALGVEFLAEPETKLADFCLAMLNRNEFVYRP